MEFFRRYAHPTLLLAPDGGGGGGGGGDNGGKGGDPPSGEPPGEGKDGNGGETAAQTRIRELNAEKNAAETRAREAEQKLRKAEEEKAEEEGRYKDLAEQRERERDEAIARANRLEREGWARDEAVSKGFIDATDAVLRLPLDDLDSEDKVREAVGKLAEDEKLKHLIRDEDEGKSPRPGFGHLGDRGGKPPAERTDREPSTEDEEDAAKLGLGKELLSQLGGGKK